jgi:hypothetical protein
MKKTYQKFEAFAVELSLNLHNKIIEKANGNINLNRTMITGKQKTFHAIYHCETDVLNRIKSCPILRGAINRTEI